ncbi:hypothetical protein AGJ35_08145 [Cronobacter dublinensis subsp. dublinensis]|nr:hypothetical protein [Cronobacter dublinensis subsp. dublinensis]EGT5735453.1 hypothetical protein [Cronobacter dublinensis subsp. dublinensis]
MHAQASQQDFLIRKILVATGAKFKHLFNGRKRTIHLGITSLIAADIITTVTNHVNLLFRLITNGYVTVMSFRTIP